MLKKIKPSGMKVRPRAFYLFIHLLLYLFIYDTEFSFDCVFAWMQVFVGKQWNILILHLA